jgi:hypothetical protein
MFLNKQERGNKEKKKEKGRKEQYWEKHARFET